MSNAQLIINVLAAHGPLTKNEIIKLMGKHPSAGAKYGYNVNAYLSNVGDMAKAAKSNQSLINSGHVIVVGCKSGAFVYGLTSAGLACVRDA